MIKNQRAYDELCERERWEELARMSIDESIAIGEALHTSEIMDRAEFVDDDAPMSLARSLGLVR